MHLENLIDKKRLSVYLRKASRYFKRNFEGKVVDLNEVQISSFSLIKKLIKHKDSDLIYSPISLTYYIENGDYYVRYTNNSLTITNGKFSYYVWLPDDKIEILQSLFHSRLESKKTDLDKKYNSNTLKSFREIHQSLENRSFFDTVK
jgi:hypothetical protein